MLGLENSVRQLRHLACRKVSMTTLSSIRTPVLVLVVYVDDIVITLVTPKAYYLVNHFFTVSFTQRI